MSEWKQYCINELGDVVTGKTPSSKNPEDFGGDTLFITPSDYNGYVKYLDKADRKLSTIGTSRLQNKVLPKQCVMVTCIGSDMGKVAINKQPVITNQQINSIIPRKELISTDFLYYTLINDYDTLKMYGLEGTAVPIINKSTFESIALVIPPLPEQEAIAEVLSSLDDKIDLLHSNNKTLEQLAETLFRQWFVEEAEESWEVVRLNAVVDIHRGLSYKGSGLCDNATPGAIMMMNLNSVFEGGGYKSEGVKYYCGEYRDRHVIYPGDLIVTNTEQGHEHRLIGCGAIVPKAVGLNAIFSQHIYRVVPKNERLSANYLYYLLKMPSARDQIIGATNGSTVNMLPVDGIERVEIVLPPISKFKKFNEFTTSVQDKKERNSQQILQLETLRDTLLPKLMSGIVRVTIN